MNVILSVYSQNAFKEYLLPSLNNADYAIVLEKDYFKIKSDVMIKLEVLDGRWRIKNGSYTIKKENRNYTGSLWNHDVLEIQTNHNEIVSMIVNEVFSVFHSYEKYNIRNVDSIYIGNTPSNDIVFN